MVDRELTPRMKQEEPSTELTTFVFVYGTLKNGNPIRGLDLYGEHTELQGKAKTKYPDYDMIDLGAFPGVIKTGTNHIVGEVWKVSDAMLEEIDGIEGYPYLYNKELTHTSLGKAWMYYLEPEKYKDYIGLESNSIIINGNNKSWKF